MPNVHREKQPGSSSGDDAISSPPAWPEDTAENEGRSSCITTTYNNWTYRYMNNLFTKGAKQRKDTSASSQLTQHDLFSVPRKDDATLLNAKFWTLFNDTTDHNFFQTLWLLVKPTFVPGVICQLIALCAQLSIPLCVMKLLQEIENNTDATTTTTTILTDAIPYVILIFILSIINALFSHRHQFLSYQSGIIIRSAVTTAIYERALNLSPVGREGLTSGNVTNLVATDTQKLFEVMHEAHMIWSAPLAILIVIALLFIIIGPSCFVGAFILIGLIPLSKKVAHIIVRIRKRRVVVADERIEIVAAMLQDIKVTKLNNYEENFEERVMNARKREMAFVTKEQCVWGFTLVIRVFTPVLASYFTLVTYVLLGNIMTASTVFTLAMLFYMLKFPINQAGHLLSKAALGVQAMHRISRFMRRDIKEDDTTDIEESDNKNVLEVRNGMFFVGTNNIELSKSSEAVDDEEGYGSGAAFTLSNINFKVERGEVLAVVGSVASGKSSLMSGLLGDIQSSKDTLISTARGSRVSYAAQTPFILSTTVRENILFGSEYDDERYNKVLDACCLRQDIAQWPAADLTEIGERGVTMSGGQKSRVSIARAVYANPDVGLFDDVLSALDAGTSKSLFDNVFANIGSDDKSLLHNSGIVLVTHAVHILQRVNKILVLDKGECIFYGRYDEMQAAEHPKLRSMRSSSQLSSLGKEDNAKQTTKRDTTVVLANNNDAVDAKNGELMTVEERQHGMSSLSVWLLWFQYAGGLVFIIIQICFMACDRGSYVLIDWWLATWTSAVGNEITVLGFTFPDQYDSQTPYLIVYSTLCCSMLVFLVARSQWAVFGELI